MFLGTFLNNKIKMSRVLYLSTKNYDTFNNLIKMAIFEPIY